jgi:hypothetical protein
MKAKLILPCAVLFTGLICYLTQLLLGLSLALPFVSPLFPLTHDLFGDFIKHVGSYLDPSTIHVEAWMPADSREIIQTYVDHNSKSNPALAGSTLTHFNSPPIVQIFVVAFAAKLLALLGPLTSFFIINLILLAVLFWCVSLCCDNNRDRWLLFLSIIFLYPSLFAFLRGNLYSVMSTLGIAISFVLAAARVKPVFWAYLGMSVAIGFRPNNILFLPLLCILQQRLIPGLPSLGKLLASAIAIAVLSILFSFALAKLLYPVYEPKVFLAAYSYYSKLFEFGFFGSLNGSSLLQPLFLMAKYLELKLPSFYFPQLLLLIRVSTLTFGLAICGFSYYYAYGKNASLPRAILLNVIGLMMATPVFADYHLMVLIVPVLIAICLESRDKQLDGRVSFHSNYAIARSDALVLILLLAPKPFVIPYSLNTASGLMQANFTVGTFVNPAVAMFYLVYLVIAFRAKRSVVPVGF